MKGGVTYHDIMEMTLLEKQLLVEVVEAQVKLQQKNPLLKLLSV